MAMDYVGKNNFPLTLQLGESGGDGGGGGVSRIAAADWHRCAGTEKNPFLRHEFLTALEESGSVGGATGWHPLPLIGRDGQGKIIAVAPLYGKDHSYGEYVFDQPWAAAFAQAGGAYYPKLQMAVPFTPVAGPRFLVAADAPPGVRDGLVRGLKMLCHDQGYSGVHATFVARDCGDEAAFLAAGFLPRYDYQFHWHNPGYEDFDGFLAALNHRKRKAIKKERAAATQLGLDIVTLVGDAIKPHHWDGFYRCYRATSGRKWGNAYLTRDFFTRIGETMKHDIVLILAMEGAQVVGGAINFRGGDVLYGRNWGCLAEIPFLHFECCYYRAIEFAIEHGLSRVEAGAQGLHKIKRGYLPSRTQSFHYLAHPGLARAVGEFLDHERRGIEENISALMQESPFREGG
ncbi:MAG: GNAT family N-acetyltransferase [Candidatus Symbiobacter sp.]|nr:GNAT family N-acetyltransferase [Candidatus Symbiobacter sp.]